MGPENGARKCSQIAPPATKFPGFNRFPGSRAAQRARAARITEVGLKSGAQGFPDAGVKRDLLLWLALAVDPVLARGTLRPLSQNSPHTLTHLLRLISMMKYLFSAILALPLLAFVASGDETAPAAPAAAPVPAAPAAPAATDAPANKHIIGVIPGVMQFDKKSFTVKSGEAIQILFKNAACPLQHNLVILKAGTDVAFGTAAMSMMAKDAAAAGTKSYIPDDATSTAAIIAKSSKLIGLGQNDVISFTAPAAGDYPFICTFPGHSFVMKGVMKVVP
jgi:azurin